MTDMSGIKDFSGNSRLNGYSGVFGILDLKLVFNDFCNFSTESQIKSIQILNFQSLSFE